MDFFFLLCCCQTLLISVTPEAHQEAAKPCSSDYCFLHRREETLNNIGQPGWLQVLSGRESPQQLVKLTLTCSSTALCRYLTFAISPKAALCHRSGCFSGYCSFFTRYGASNDRHVVSSDCYATYYLMLCSGEGDCVFTMTKDDHGTTQLKISSILRPSS